jgi:hypothetical protein
LYATSLRLSAQYRAKQQKTTGITLWITTVDIMAISVDKSGDKYPAKTIHILSTALSTCYVFDFEKEKVLIPRNSTPLL